MRSRPKPCFPGGGRGQTEARVPPPHTHTSPIPGLDEPLPPHLRLHPLLRYPKTSTWSVLSPWVLSVLNVLQKLGP